MRHEFLERPRFVVLVYDGVQAQSASWTTRYLNEDIPDDYRIISNYRWPHGNIELVLERTDRQLTPADG